jgi:LemA protein
VIVVIILVVLVLLAGLFYVLTRNGIIGSRNRVDEAWSGIDVQLKRRHDLVPNLVEAVKGYAQHEQGTFEKVTQARAAAMSATGVEDVSKAEGALSGALGGLRVVAEQYPELRATENFQQLSRNLSELEDEIQASRRIYNSNVQAYNTKIQVFPNSIIANQGGFTARQFFEIDNAADRDVPEVDFGGNSGGPQSAPAEPAK